MDPRPFDAVARLLATGHTRRDALRALAAVCVGAGGVRFASESIEAKGVAQGKRDHRSTPRRRGRNGVSPQIAGGTPVPPGKYPFAASLRMHGVASDFLCSGSLIDASHVLTAAHCTFDTDAGRSFPLNAYTVLVGQVDRTSTSCAVCRKHVSAVAVDPNWTGAGSEFVEPHDVAVLTLDSPVDASIGQPIELIGSGASDLDAAGHAAIAAGWGITTTDGDASDVLMEAPLTVIADAACGADSSQMCTSVIGGRAICSGDSGGPLFVALTDGAAGLGASNRKRSAARGHHHHHHHHGGCLTQCPTGCAPELNAVCCPPDSANPNGGYCHAGETCCPPSAQFPGGSCAPAGTTCDGGGGGGGSRFIQIGVVNGAPAGCPSPNGTSDIYVRLSNPTVHAFVQNAEGVAAARSGNGAVSAARPLQPPKAAAGVTNHGQGAGRTNAGASRRKK